MLRQNVESVNWFLSVVYNEIMLQRDEITKELVAFKFEFWGYIKA